MKRYLLFLFTSVCVFSTHFLHAQQYGWAKHFYVPGSVDPSILILNEGKAMAKDLSGNLYLTGTFADTVDFDPGAGTFFLSSRFANLQNQFVTKLSPEGNLVWADNIGNNSGSGGQVYPNAIAAGLDGSVYSTGYFTGIVDFDPGSGVANITATNPGNVFISKLNPDGSYAWTKVLTGTSNLDNGYGIAVDGNNNVYAAGEYSGTIDVDPGAGVINITAVGSTDGFVVKLNSAGNYVTHRNVSTAAQDRVMGIVFKNGLLYTITWMSVTAAITKHSPDLNIIWEKRTQNIGGTAWPWSLNIDDAGNAIMVGSFSSTVDFDPGTGVYPLTAVGTNDRYICKWDRLGNFEWAKRSVQNNFETNVTSDRNGDIYYTFCGNQEFNILKYNFKGDYQWTANMTANGSFIVDDVVADDDGNIFSTGYFTNNADFDPDPAVYNPLIVGPGKSGAFTSKISNKNHISGEAFLDANNDGIRQAGEDPLPYRITQAQGSSLNFNGITRTDGFYDIYTDSGSYNITIPYLPPYYTSAVASHTASFASGVGGIDSLNNFPIVPILSVNDLSVKLIATQRLRRGSVCYADLIYTNTGTTTMSGSITLRHAPALVYQNATPSPTVYTNPLLTWNFTNLRPFETRTIYVNLLVPFNLPNGTAVNQVATIYPVVNDSTPLNNRDSVDEVVVGSYDPNDKSVFPAGGISKSFICADSALDYVVRFQNTGNDTAFLVIIADTIQNNLDLKSIQVIGASHPFITRIDEGRIIKFIFKNIMLPDSTTNEPLSHGFVAYKIKPLSNLAVGVAIKNSAAIYFDFNTAVITNQTSNTVIPLQPASVSISSPNSTTCSGIPINFTATAGYGGNAPVYQWQVNGVNAGTNSPTFTSSTLNNGDQVSCLLTSSNSGCVTTPNATSNIITVTIGTGVVPSASISTASTNICAGDAVTFTANAVNGGATPTYQWQVNGVNAGTNSNIFTTSTLTNNAQIKVMMTSSLSCATPNNATSNIITMTVTPAPTAQAGNDTAICAGSSVQLLGSGGTVYQWTPVTGLNNPNIANPIATPLATTAYILRVSNGGSCIAYDTILITLLPSAIPAVTISTASNNICTGTSVTFTATPTNGGSTPTYQWQVNGVNAGTNSNTFITSTLTNNAQVKVILTSSLGCALPATVTSNVITMAVNPFPIANAGNDVNICTGGSTALQATGGTTYSWSPVAGLSNPNIANPIASPVVTTTYTVTVSNGINCTAYDTVVVSVGPPATPTVNISTAANNICLGSAATFTAVATNGGSTPAYQWQVNAVNAGSNSNVFTSTALQNNSQVKVIMTSSSGCVTTPTATSNIITINVDQLATPLISVADRLFTVTNPDAAATYTWQQKINNIWTNVVPAATGTTYTAPAGGEYRVKAVKGACTDFSASQTTSRNLNVLTHPFGIYLYPNPNTGILNIDSIRITQRWETLDITDVTGRLVLTFKIKNQSSVSLNISMLKPGTYFAQLKKIDGVYYTVEFVKL